MTSGAGSEDIHQAEDEARAVDQQKAIPFNMEAASEAMKGKRA